MDPTERPDADALICTDFRSRPTSPLHREFDTFGQERVTRHLLRLIVEHSDRIDRCAYLSRSEKKASRSLGTGVLINAAPRTDHSNGAEFHVAQLRNNLRVVCTGLEPLASVRDSVESVKRIPNESNGLWPDGEQFRSSYAPALLNPQREKDVVLHPVDLNAIPTVDPEAWEVAYIDRFGNIITSTRDVTRKLFDLQVMQTHQSGFRLHFGKTAVDGLVLGQTLGSADPGSLVVYGNGNIDFVRKWDARDTAQDKIARSAYHQFGRPVVGTRITTEPISRSGS